MSDRSTYKVGQTWYARISDAQSLATVEIRDITSATVLVHIGGHYGSKARYEWSQIAFIELALLGVQK